MYMSMLVQQPKPVPFPPFTGEKVYMLPFYKAEGLPAHLARWQPTVDAMLDGIDVPGPAYLMISQKDVPAGKSHRRPGVHIDGYWVPSIQAHRGKHRATHADSGDWGTDNEWRHCDFSTPEALVLAADVEASQAYLGEWYGAPGKGGDCAHINTRGMVCVGLKPHRAYVGNVTMLHESVPLYRPFRRTLVRINVPGWSI